MLEQIIEYTKESTNKQKIPNSIPSLVMGGISLLLTSLSVGFYYGMLTSYIANRDSPDIFVIILAIISVVPSIVLAVLSLAKASKGNKIFNASPDSYYGVGMLKAATTMSIIALVYDVIAISIAIVMAIFG